MPDDTHDRIPGYLGAMTAFGASVLVTTLLGRARGKELPDRFDVVDLALGAVATHKFTRILSKDAVTTPIRAPFTEFEKPLGSPRLRSLIRVAASPTGLHSYVVSIGNGPCAVRMTSRSTEVSSTTS